MSESTRSQLIAAGLKLYPQYGYGRLSVRVLAAEAGVSAGMFHHLFDNKDAFVAELLETHHRHTFGRLNLDNIGADNPFQCLREVLLRLALCLRDNLAWVQRAFADSGEGAAVIKAFWQRHFSVQHQRLTVLLNRCEAGDEAELAHRLAYLTGAIGAPMVIGMRMHEMGVLPSGFGEHIPEIISDAAIGQRIDWALAALFPQADSFLQAQERT
ncbi:MAG: TetR/AcrR family transcriptional regulator [Neisseria sp.]|nr:TetR/AcrR family transcriptional regulator [Neisseria sp.]